MSQQLLFPTIIIPDLSKCNLCGFDIQDSMCGCGLPEEDTRLYSTYINHCWNCKSAINSDICKLSNTPEMGYHCNLCGKDLTEWKQRVGLIPA